MYTYSMVNTSRRCGIQQATFRDDLCGDKIAVELKIAKQVTYAMYTA